MVPIAEVIGFRVEAIGGGRAVGSLRSGPQHANTTGTLHGGVLCHLSDAAMGMAFVRRRAQPFYQQLETLQALRVMPVKAFSHARRVRRSR